MRERKPETDPQRVQGKEPPPSRWFPTIQEDDLEEEDTGGGQSGQRVETSYPPPDEDVE